MGKVSSIENIDYYSKPGRMKKREREKKEEGEKKKTLNNHE